MPEFNDPDGLLDGTEPVPESEAIPERFDDPYRPGDPFEIPETRPKRETGPARAMQAFKGRDPMDVAMALAAAGRDRGAPEADPAQPTDVARLEREARELHLAALRWHGPTEHAQQMVDRCHQAITGYAEKSVAQGKKFEPPVTLRRETAHWEKTLAECQERDQLMAERQARFPGCWCLGNGGRDRVAIAIWTQGALGERVAYRPRLPDGAEAMTWMDFCVCDKGQAAQGRATALRRRMQQLVDAQRAERILGEARIPERYKDWTLANYPDQVAAGKVQAWYLRAVGEIPIPPGLNHRKGLYLHGPNRRGKTTLSIGILKLALERGIPGVFRTVREVLRELRAAYGRDANATFDEVLDALRKAPLLILDDIGAERLTRGDTWIVEVLMGLLEYRETNDLITVMSSNLGWTERSEARRRRAIEEGAIGDKQWRLGDYDPEELLDYLGERLWWRVDSMTNKLPLIGDVLGYATLPSPLPAEPTDEL